MELVYISCITVYTYWAFLHIRLCWYAMICVSQRDVRMYDGLGGVSAAVSAARVWSASELGAGFVDVVV